MQNNAPLMYKGFLIKIEKNGKLSAHNLATGVYFNPLYNS